MIKGLIVGGLCLIIIAVIITPRTITEYRIQRNTEAVTVKLLELPVCEDGSYRKNNYLTLEYNGIKTILKTKCKYVKDFHIGQEIQMFHQEGTDIFVFPSENIRFDLFCDLGIGLMGLIIIIIGLRKKY